MSLMRRFTDEVIGTHIPLVLDAYGRAPDLDQ